MRVQPLRISIIRVHLLHPVPTSSINIKHAWKTCMCSAYEFFGCVFSYTHKSMHMHFFFQMQSRHTQGLHAYKLSPYVHDASQAQHACRLPKYVCTVSPYVGSHTMYTCRTCMCTTYACSLPTCASTRFIWMRVPAIPDDLCPSSTHMTSTHKRCICVHIRHVLHA